MPKNSPCLSARPGSFPSFSRLEEFSSSSFSGPARGWSAAHLFWAARRGRLKERMGGREGANFGPLERGATAGGEMCGT